MTIFFHFLTKFLEKEIKAFHADSFSRDSSYSNNLFRFIGGGRDTELSETKRKLAIELLNQIVKLNEKNTDSLNYENIKNLILDYKKQAAKESIKKNYDEGTFGPFLKRILEITDDVYLKLKEAELLDVNHDQEPLNLFSTAIAAYLCKKVYESKHKNKLTTLLSHPMVSNNCAIAKEKETIAVNARIRLLKDLEKLDKNHPEYHENCKERVIEHADKLNRENQALCNKYGIVLSIPFDLTFFSKLRILGPKYGPKLGDLDKSIQKLEMQLDKSMSFEKK